MKYVAAAIVLLVGAAVAAPAPEAESYFGWRMTGAADPASRVSFTLGLRMREGARAALHAKFLSVSVDKEYLSKEALDAMVAPPEGAVERVLAWGRERGLTCAAGSVDVVRCEGGVAQVESAFPGVVFGRFERAPQEVRLLKATTVVDVPRHLAEVVEVVNGLDNFPVTSAMAAVSAGAPQVTPKLLKALYNVTDTAASGSGSSMAVAEFQGQGYLPSDLAAFESGEGLPAQKVRQVLGGDPNAQKTAGVEASLDIQYILATGTGVPVDFYLQAGGTFDLLEFAAFVLNQTNPALVWSVSYGEGINGGIGGNIKVSAAQRLNAEFEKFAVRGLSVLVASGDSGVYNRVPFVGKLKFHPSYPACLPSVTAVGATELTSTGQEDSGVDWSGGGFTPSEYFGGRNASAPWQDESVSAYLASGVKLPPSYLWDQKGRGLPDVSAVGVDYKVWAGSVPQGVSGTSASTPAVAGVFALINDKLLAAGKKPLGFLNPFIYQNQHCFRDITKGINDGGGIFHIFTHGFYATKGWDPITGVGTPNYEALKEAAMASAF